jgi:hypothetical protein
MKESLIRARSVSIIAAAIIAQRKDVLMMNKPATPHGSWSLDDEDVIAELARSLYDAIELEVIDGWDNED